MGSNLSPLPQVPMQCCALLDTEINLPLPVIVLILDGIVVTELTTVVSMAPVCLIP